MLPILITSAAIPNDPGSVNLKSFELRKKYTIDSILYWRKLAPQNPLIICDGSNFSFSEILSEINLDTSLIDVDVHPTFVTIIAKNKTLRLKFPEEVS
jgi:hypothetical protein